MDNNRAVEAEPATDDLDDELDADGFDGGLLGSRRVRTLMNDLVATTPPASSIREAAAALSAGDTSLIVIGELDQIEGVVSERDIVRAVADGLDLDNTPISALESRDLLWASPDSTVDHVAVEMMENYVRHILIRDDEGQPVGVVSIRDVLTEYLD